MINNILISKDKRRIQHRDTRYLGVEGENLQEILIFNLDEDIVGQGIIEIEFKDGTKGFVEIERTERGYELPVKSSLLTQSGTVKIQLRILQDKQEVFKSEIMDFIVKQAINATETIPEQYPIWIDNLETLKASLEEAESERVTAENKRVEAESKREETFKQMQEEQTTQNNRLDRLEKDNTTNKSDIANIKEEQSTQNTNISNLQEDNGTNKTKIEELQNKVVELETENEVLKNQIPCGQAEGENITLNDSAEMEFKELKVSGNSWQETREGYNLFNNTFNGTVENGLTVTTNKDKTLSVNGTTTDNVFIKLGDITLPAGSYRLTGCPSNGSSSTYRLYVIGAASAYDNGAGANFKLENEGTLEVRMVVYSGVTLNVLYKPMIISGIEDKPYEPYGAMPSPEFNSEIKNVTGSANIKITRKNLITRANIPNSSSVMFYFDRAFNIVIGQIYTLSFIIDDDLSGNSCYLRAGDYNRIVTYYGGKANAKVSRAFTFTEEDINAIKTSSVEPYFQIYKSDGGITTVSEAQLELGQATEYIPHQSQSITFPLSEGQRLYKGSCLADDGIHHKRGQTTIKISSITTLSNGNIGGICNTSNKIYKSNNNLICSNAIFDKSRALIEGTVYENERNVAFVGNSEDTLETLKSKYDGGMLEYELAEELIESYTEEQQIVYNQIKKATSYKNITHIFSTDEISPQFEIIYKKDLETMFNNINNAVLGGN